MICIIEEWPGDISFCFWRFVAFPREYRVCYLHVYLELVDSETMPSECNVVNQHRGSLSVQTSNSELSFSLPSCLLLLI
ncbi:hypothetical protein LINPERPRIM_LOCUS41090 [Linum perenne]